MATRGPAQGGVPVVFDCIVGATREEASDGGPSVAVPGVGREDDGVLGWCERAVLHLGAQLVAPPQAARLPRSAHHRLAYQ